VGHQIINGVRHTGCGESEQGQHEYPARKRP
jgi:hypothetical protein